MNWSELLKSNIRERAAAWGASVQAVPYRSKGAPGTVMFRRTNDQHGNFFAEVYAAIRSDNAWSGRLEKAHPQRRHLPSDFAEDAKELDSSNSSDALLMNMFCYPGASPRLASVLGATPADAAPRFGVPGKLNLRTGSPDQTELDMVLGDTIVEAKFTELNFTSKPKSHVSRYDALSDVFDLSLLPGKADSLQGFQLIRNVLAAAQHGRRLVVAIDYRRPDLLKEWWNVHTPSATVTFEHGAPSYSGKSLRPRRRPLTMLCSRRSTACESPPCSITRRLS